MSRHKGPLYQDNGHVLIYQYGDLYRIDFTHRTDPDSHTRKLNDYEPGYNLVIVFPRVSHVTDLFNKICEAYGVPQEDGKDFPLRHMSSAQVEQLRAIAEAMNNQAVRS
jgi:hypothetical protein